MQVQVVQSLNNIDIFNFDVSNVKEVLMMLKHQKGQEYTDNIIKNKFKYVLLDSLGIEEPLALREEVIFSAIAPYDTICIIADIEGEVTVSVGVAIVGYLASASAATIATSAALTLATIAVTAAINIAIAFAVSFVISLLSPTPEFSSDPSQAQLKQSNLFNGAPLIREQGGIVPLIYGNPFCGGVLISSGLTTEETIGPLDGDDDFSSTAH